MPRRPGQVVEYRCRKCGATFPTFQAVGVHSRAIHAPRPDSPLAAGPSVSRETGPRRIEDVSGSPVTEAPDDPLSTRPDEPTGGRLRPSRPQLSQPTIRITPEMRTESVRDSIRDALPLQTLADLLHAFSVAVSEADGAGPAGYLSEIQCTQVAVLLYDGTIELVVSRFDGNVSRFKAGMAVLIILMSKGTVHARAISAKLAERRGDFVQRQPEAPAPVEPSTNGHVPTIIPGIPISPDMAGTYAEALARQRAMENQEAPG